MKYWLMKSEPDVFSIDDLEQAPNQTTYWDGVRNYQARNFMRDEMKVGDSVLYYHSRTNPSVVGTAKVVKEGYPDHTAWDPKDPHFDPKSNPDKPTWIMVDIQFESKFQKPVPLSVLKETEGLEEMLVIKRGMRLSIQPVTADQYEIVKKLGQ